MISLKKQKLLKLFVYVLVGPYSDEISKRILSLGDKDGRLK